MGNSFLDKTGLAYLWQKIIAYVDLQTHQVEIYNVRTPDAKNIYITYKDTPESIFVYGRASTDVDHIIVSDVITMTNGGAPIAHLGTNSSITVTKEDLYNIVLHVPSYTYVCIIAPAGTKFTMS